jgi:hypothetical protein
MRGGGYSDTGFPAVGHHEPLSLTGNLTHAHRPGQSADPPDVGLNDVNSSAIHQVEELNPRGEPLAGGDSCLSEFGEASVARPREFGPVRVRVLQALLNGLCRFVLSVGLLWFGRPGVV